jgi:hypothetical protein
MNEDIKLEKMKVELLLFLTCEDDITLFRKALTQVFLEWIEENSYPRNADKEIVHRMHLMISFFDKIEEIDKMK